MAFIGELEIVSKEPVSKEGYSTLEFEGGHIAVVKDSLVELLASEEKGNGNITDKINDHFARKFVAELSSHGLSFYFAENVGVGMGTLAHNLREALLSKTFGCAGGNDIPLDTIVGSIE